MSSFSASEKEEFAAQKTQLISEQQKFQHEIQRLKLCADGCEYDLQVGKVAFNFAESTVMWRMRKLGTMFGVMLKSDEKSFEGIQAFMQEVQDDEATAADLSHEIE
jgi:hypothetical protein